MPKWGIHNIVLDEAIGKLLLSPNTASQGAGTDLANHRGLSMLGAIGPDLFFFAPDYEAVDRFYRLYKNIEEVIDLYNDFVQPFRDIRDAVVDPVEDAVETLAPATVAEIRILVEEIKETASLFSSTITTGLFAGVIDGFDFVSDLANLPTLSSQLFQLFVPDLQKQAVHNETSWYWFDMLHYRQTGQFGRSLVENATTAQQRAYAYGYLSHIGTDLVGHPFVNQIVGGPYRLHPQRHVTVENFMDARVFKDLDGTDVGATLLDRLGIPEVLPPEIGDLIDAAFRQTYANSPHPNRPQTPNDGFLSRNQIDQTYEIVFDYLKIVAKMTIKRPEEPFSGVADVLADALAGVLDPPPTAPNLPSGACSVADILSFGATSDSRDCYDEFFDQLADWMAYLGELLAWSLETLLDVIDLLLATLLSLPIKVLLAILYGIQVFLYEIYQTMRFTLVLSGFAYPSVEDVNTSHGRNLTTMFNCLFIGTRTATTLISVPEYPRMPNLLRSHLVCPNLPIEEPATFPDFYPYSQNTTADDFIRNQPLDLGMLAQYANAVDQNGTINLEYGAAQIGNAIDLTAWLISIASDPSASESDRRVAFTNWNLDGDRGYGFKTWSGNVTKNPVADIQYINEA